MRHRMTRMTHKGDTLPGQFKDKHYVSVTSCFATGLDNTFTHQTDATLVAIDKAMTAAGVHKITELVLPHTWGMASLPLAKVNQAHQLGEKLGTFKKRMMKP